MWHYLICQSNAKILYKISLPISCVCSISPSKLLASYFCQWNHNIWLISLASHWFLPCDILFSAPSNAIIWTGKSKHWAFNRRQKGRRDPSGILSQANYLPHFRLHFSSSTSFFFSFFFAYSQMYLHGSFCHIKTLVAYFAMRLLEINNTKTEFQIVSLFISPSFSSFLKYGFAKIFFVFRINISACERKNW